MSGIAKAGRNWHKLQEIAFFDLIIENKPIGGFHDGKMANKLEVVWEPVVAAFKLAMPPLVPLIKEALKADKSTAGIRVDFDETACRTKWTTWLTKYKEVKDKHGVTDYIGRGETGKAGTGRPCRDDSEKMALCTEDWHLFLRFHVQFGGKARLSNQKVVDNLDTPGKPKLDRPTPIKPKASKSAAKTRRALFIPTTNSPISDPNDASDSDDYRKPKRARKFTQYNMETIKKVVETKMDAKKDGPSEMEEYKVIAEKERQTIQEYGERSERTEIARIASEDRNQRLARVAALRSDFQKEGMTIAEAQKAAIQLDNDLQRDLV